MSRVIVVTSGKGGVGKSSVSVNVASALAFSKFKVCLIDGDFGLKNLDVMMGLENRVGSSLGRDGDAFFPVCFLGLVI